MTLIRRRPPGQASPPEPVEPLRPGGKGRATPKRQQAREARRYATSTPSDPKAARQQSRDERRRRTAEYREGMRSGDPAKLPPGERQPERVLARDIVDRRFNVGPLFLVILAVNLLGGLVPVPALQRTVYFAMLAGFAILVVDSVLLARQVRRAVRARYPDSTAKLGRYAAQRALMPGRWRMPRPRVSREQGLGR